MYLGEAVARLKPMDENALQRVHNILFRCDYPTALVLTRVLTKTNAALPCLSQAAESRPRAEWAQW